MRKRGAKPKYQKDYARQAFVACSEGGFTDAKLAKLFKVTKNTVKNWKRDYSEFLASVRDGKDIWDTRMAEDCILKRIKGYRYSEETKEVGADGKLKTTKVVRKEVAGDVKAQIFWLRNRNRDRWPDTRTVDQHNTVDLGDDAKKWVVNFVDKTAVNNEDPE